MKKYWKYSKEQLRDVFSTTEQGLSEMQVKKSGKHVGKYTGRGKKTRASEGVFVTVCRFTHCHLLIAALISMCSGNGEYDCNRSCPGDECSFGNGAAPESGKSLTV